MLHFTKLLIQLLAAGADPLHQCFYFRFAGGFLSGIHITKSTGERRGLLADLVSRPLVVSPAFSRFRHFCRSLELDQVGVRRKIRKRLSHEFTHRREFLVGHEFLQIGGQLVEAADPLVVVEADVGGVAIDEEDVLEVGALVEVADDPCFVYLSSSGLLARTTSADAPGQGGPRGKHDVITSAVRATARGEVGLLTSQGRVIKLGVLDLPTLPSTANDPHLTGGAPVSEFVSLDANERVLGLTSFADGSLGLAVGTKQGIVKRVNPEYLANKDDWDYISLKDGDEVILTGGTAGSVPGSTNVVEVSTVGEDI